jgi:uncharacterized protein YodC (DUF2158 family)
MCWPVSQPIPLRHGGSEMRDGEMVRADGGGPLMKIVDKRNGEARCVWFDQRGSIHSQYFEMDRLSPFWLSTSPKSLWPDITQIDLIAIEQEERVAAKVRKVNRRNSKKAKRSNKISRRRNVAA